MIQVSDDAEAIGLLVSLLSAVVVGILAALATWMYAPPVGGEFWPYIRVGAALVAGIIGAKLGIVLAALLTFALLGLVIATQWVIDR